MGEGYIEIWHTRKGMSWVLGKLLKLHIEKKMEGGGVTGKGGNNTELQKLKEWGD